MIPNPRFKGKWQQPMVQNPEWTEDMDSKVGIWDIGYVGFEIWQVKAGTIFDDILITDSEEEAMEIAKNGWQKHRAKELEAKNIWHTAEIERIREEEERLEREERLRMEYERRELAGEKLPSTPEEEADLEIQITKEDMEKLLLEKELRKKKQEMDEKRKKEVEEKKARLAALNSPNKPKEKKEEGEHDEL